jgi:hypothetical protein
MATLIWLVSLTMGLHLCCLESLTLLEEEQKFKLGGCVGSHKTSISCTNMSSKCME